MREYSELNTRWKHINCSSNYDLTHVWLARTLTNNPLYLDWINLASHKSCAKDILHGLTTKSAVVLLDSGCPSLSFISKSSGKRQPEAQPNRSGPHSIWLVVVEDGATDRYGDSGDRQLAVTPLPRRALISPLLWETIGFLVLEVGTGKNKNSEKI